MLLQKEYLFPPASRYVAIVSSTVVFLAVVIVVVITVI
jgi:hypothetical protein